jgi:hypothetical protein
MDWRSGGFDSTMKVFLTRDEERLGRWYHEMALTIIMYQYLHD